MAKETAQGATPNPTWYDILGVARDATPEQVKAAWRAATDKFEPGSGTSQWRLFNEAADVLLDPERRAAYDAELAGGAGPEATAEVEPVELPVPEPGPAPAVVPDETAATEPVTIDEPVAAPEPVEPEGAPAPRADGFLGRLAAIPTLVLAVLGVVLVAAVVLAAVLGMRLQQRVDVFEAGPDASAAAERALTAVLSYDYRHMEADRDRAAQFLTPSYRKEYIKNFDDLLTKGPDGTPGPAEKTKAVVTADVLDTAVVDAERDRVRVLVFVNQSSVKGDAAPTVFQNRVVATLVHQGDRWLVDNIKSY
jgi:Mce-associated membrane protein